MQIRQLEMLSAVVEKAGYLGAGESMQISHTAIHRQIRLLEEELNQKLFIRTGRSMQLTEAGRLLYDFASRMKQDVKSIQQTIRDLSELVGGQLRVGTGSSVLTLFLPSVLEEFHDKYPGVQLRIITGTAEQIVAEIMAGNLDIGLVREPSEDWPAKKNLYYEKLYDEEYSLVVSPKHALAKETAVQWTDLKDHPMITFPNYSRVRRIINQFFEQAGVSPEIIMELENEEAIEKMINLSFGAGFIARRRTLSDGLHRVTVGEKKILLSIAVVHSKSYVPRRVEEFLRICRAHSLQQR